MKIRNRILFTILIALSFQSYAQVIDSAILEQLTPDQVEALSKTLESQDIVLQTNSGKQPEISDSTISNLDTIDGNLIPGRKYGYDFLSTMPTSTTAIADLPLPNDYKISLRDQLTVILSGSKDAVFDLNVKLDGTILFPELGSISVAGLTLAKYQ